MHTSQILCELKTLLRAMLLLALDVKLQAKVNLYFATGFGHKIALKVIAYLH